MLIWCSVIKLKYLVVVELVMDVFIVDVILESVVVWLCELGL